MGRGTFQLALNAIHTFLMVYSILNGDGLIKGLQTIHLCGYTSFVYIFRISSLSFFWIALYIYNPRMTYSKNWDYWDIHIPSVDNRDDILQELVLSPPKKTSGNH